MDVQDPPELAGALFLWINSFELADPVDSWESLQDGQRLWQILQNIDPAYFSGDLPEDASASSSNWIPRWQNLKYINRVVWTFIRDECGKLIELSKRANPDLKAMAIDATPKDSLQLTKAVLLAAMYSPESNQRMISVMDTLGTKVAIAIASCISQMESLDHKLAESAPATDVESDFERMSSPEPESIPKSKSPRFGRDPELEREERLIHAYARIRELEENAQSLTEELQHSREEVTSLQNDLTEVRYRLEHGQAEEEDEGALELLKQRANHDKESIAQLEGELADARTAIESQESQLERLHREAEESEKLREELQTLKLERDELQQKSKANENLKKKIQTLQDSDKSTQKLREDFAVAEEELQKLRPLKARVAALQKTNEESMKLIQNGEQEIFDQKTTRKRLDHDVRMLNRQLETVKEKQQRDQETIREQEEKIRDLRIGRGEDVENNESLDDEFVARDKAYADMKSKNAELEAEVNKLREAQLQRSGADDETEAAPAGPDQTAYDMLKERCEKLEKQYLDTYQENLGLESAARDAEDGVLDSQPYVEMRDRLKTETEQKTASEKRLFEVEGELADAKLRMQAAESKLSALDKDQAEALEELRKSASTDNRILHTENSRLLQHIRTYESDLDEHRSLLKHALLDKNALLKQEKNQRFQEELKLITEQLGAVVEKPERTDDMALQLTQRIEDARQQVNDLIAEKGTLLQSHQDEMETLKARAKKSEDAAAKGAKSESQENIQRELSLMTSAWYDMTRRIQSDAVVVQRRSEAPRSFLNRQRRLISNPVIPHR